MQIGTEVFGMSYYLIHRFGQVDAFQYSNLSFSTEKEATLHACSLIAAGELGNFVISDGGGRVVADDTAIKAYCEAS
jgi:hypothetical protein